jgi:DNA-binding response OmpR family regulator
MANERLLLVEDDAPIGESLSQALVQQGYETRWVTRGGDALAQAENLTPDLVVLDLALPDLSGLDVCRRLRARHADLRILILTARQDEIDVVVGLDSGADDYVTKPFRLAELLARIRAQVRRRPVMTDGPLRSGQLALDVEARRVWLAGEEVLLRPREFDLLTLLVRHAGRALRRETIIDEVWDRNWFESTKTLDMHILSIRRKLGDPGRWGGITTLRGVGYRLEEA